MEKIRKNGTILMKFLLQILPRSEIDNLNCFITERSSMFNESYTELSAVLFDHSNFEKEKDRIGFKQDLCGNTSAHPKSSLLAYQLERSIYDLQLVLQIEENEKDRIQARDGNMRKKQCTIILRICARKPEEIDS